MEKTKIGLLIAAFVLLSVLSCKNELISPPVIPGNGGARAVDAAPEGLSASQGEKGSITLSWSADENAAFYYVYRTESLLDPFARCAETSANQYKFNVAAGSTVYYRVSSVSSTDGAESSLSVYVRGTSLAQPIITDIIEVTESSATVTWYMENAFEDSYKNELLYTVYCFNGSVEVGNLALEGATLEENKATFSNLSPNTNYEYQVEAYLRSNQSASEKSDRVDAATARRLRPGAPVYLRASRGTAANKIELSFELPDMVDIALGENLYQPKPIYFVISKRLYSESGGNEYQKVCSYLGSNGETAQAHQAQGGKSFSGYTAGAVVKWTDESVSRDVEYEYQVQSYVDDTAKTITSDSSKASAAGWALSEGSLSFGDIAYTFNELGTEYASARLPLVFDFDPKGESYDYLLIQTIEPIEESHSNNPDSDIEKEIGIFTYDEITSYVAEMDLTQKTTADNFGRGVYSYEIEIQINGETVDTVSTLGKTEVSENTAPIIVEGFSVHDGYTDKFVLSWHNYENRGYTLYESDDRTNWTEIDKVNVNPDDTSSDFDLNYSYVHLSAPGITKYFAIQPFRDVGGDTPKKGQRVYAPVAYHTLGVPSVSLGGDGPSYSVITATWTPAQMADTYRIKYWYAGEGTYNTAATAATVSKNELTIDALGHFKYPFSPFANNAADAAKAGKEIHIAVDALNEGLRTKVGGDEISTTSIEDLTTHLVGPALLNLNASHAVSATEIDVSWDKVSSANGYYVFRRQFNMSNTAEQGTEAIVYYVPASDAAPINVSGKNLALVSGTKEDTSTVKAAVSFSGSRYTLKDLYLSDAEYSGSSYSSHIPAYRNQQNDMVQGFSYRYYIVPVISRGNSPESLSSIEFAYAKDGNNKNTSISYYTIQENGVHLRYNGAAAFEKDGFTIGFGQNVTATKGTYASSGNENDGIRITWSAPPRLASVAGFSPRYTVYRKATGNSAWVPLNTNINAVQYIDTPQTRGIAYEYVVGIANGSGTDSPPQLSGRFIDACGTNRDERNRPNYLGYMLEMVRMESVSRDEQKVGENFAEEVKWYSAGITNAFSNDNNWGIDGYTVFVMNRNIDGNWHEIADISSNINQANLSVKVTNNTGLLKVMRDYKHYFKVRTYVLNNGDKVYCPDPDWNYEVLFSQTANRNNQDRADFLQTDYVKWGARQITPTEFARIASLHIAWGVHNTGGNAPINWQSTLSAYWRYISNNGSSGRVGCQSSSGVGKWWFYFDKYKPDLDTNANRNNWTYSTTFLMINADNGDRYSSKMIYGDSSGAGTFPNWYGRDGSDPYGSQYIDITGPACVNGLYSGGLRYNGTSSGSALTWTGGTIQVIYPAGAAAVQISGGGQVNTPLPFSNQASHSATGDRRRTTSDEWY